jgi:succinate dehydrogenase / fumarate reductase, membrane anchor subunit
VVKRLVVGAHYGLLDWLAQRITAVVMGVYIAGFAVVWFATKPTTYDAWRGLFTQGWMRVATLIFIASLAWHAWVGVRDILMDYVHPAWLRLSLQVLTVLLLAVYAGWGIQILWR